jgi:hypothetical protein
VVVLAEGVEGLADLAEAEDSPVVVEDLHGKNERYQRAMRTSLGSFALPRKRCRDTEELPLVTPILSVSANSRVAAAKRRPSDNSKEAL